MFEKLVYSVSRYTRITFFFEHLCGINILHRNLFIEHENIDILCRALSVIFHFFFIIDEHSTLMYMRNRLY